MKTSIFKLIALLTLLCGTFTFNSCKMDPPVLPSSPIKSGSTDTTLLVSTYSTGVANPSRICYDQTGNLFVSSAKDGKVYKVLPGGHVETILQNRKEPFGLKTDSRGNLYTVLTGENQIVKITPSGAVSTVSVGLSLNQPKDLAIADDGTIYIADTQNNRILKVTTDGQTIVFAGKAGVFGIKDGKADQAHFSFPTGIRISSDGIIWVIDGDGISKVLQGQTIRRISSTGNVSTLYVQKNKNVSIVDFTVTKKDEYFNDADAVNLFLVKSDNGIYHLNLNRAETLLNSNLTAGNTDSDIAKAQFSKPVGICIKGNDMFIADGGNNAVRKITKTIK